MTVLFVLALSAVVVGFARQAGRMVKKPSADAAATITLAPGARIVSATTDSGKLVLHVATPQGSEVEVIDLASGRLTAQIKTAQVKAH